MSPTSPCADSGAPSAAWCWDRVEIANVVAHSSASVIASPFTSSL
jgi:hypothetical protein